MKILYILSLPRSGSTLLQKYLARNTSIYTISEPWIALPLSYLFKEDKVFSEYEHHLFLRSYNDLRKQNINIENLSNKIFRTAIDEYYKGISPENVKVLIDKTPRYSIICSELFSVYKDATYILLLRHPLSCISSMVNTFGNGNWCMYRFDTDVNLGLFKLLDLYTNNHDKENLITIKYEDFVKEPEIFYNKICTYVDVDPYKKCTLAEVKLAGSLGDPTGEKKYGGSVGGQGKENSWSPCFNTVYRRLWAKSYLNKIGKARFNSLGYNFEESQLYIYKNQYSLKQEIKDIPHIILFYLHKYTGAYVTFTKLLNMKKRLKVFGVR